MVIHTKTRCRWGKTSFFREQKKFDFRGLFTRNEAFQDGMMATSPSLFDLKVTVGPEIAC